MTNTLTTPEITFEAALPVAGSALAMLDTERIMRGDLLDRVGTAFAGYLAMQEQVTGGLEQQTASHPVLQTSEVQQ